MRETLPIRAFAVFFVATAAAAIVIGLHDAAIDGVALGVTITSVVLLVVSVMALLAARQLFEIGRRSSWKDGKRPPCKQRVLIAFLVTTFLATYVFFAGLRTQGAQRPFVVAAAVVGIAIGIAGLVYFWREGAAALPHIATTIALGLVGTGIGLSEFWYQNEYVPSQLEGAVSLTVGLRLAAVQKDFDVIRARIDYENLGGRNVAVIGSAYTLTGSRVVRCDRPATPQAVQGFFGNLLVDPQRSRFMANVWEDQPAAVLATGKFVGDGARLDANVPAGRDLLFYVPRGRYQLLRLRAQVYAISASIQLSRRRLPEQVRFPGDQDVYNVWHIQDDSWLHDLIYGRERSIVTRYELVGRPNATSASPDLRVSARFPDPTWISRAPSATTLHNLFAVPEPDEPTAPFADTELQLEPIAAPTVTDNVPSTCRP